jgi:uncharacterized lipoprotein YajG
MKKLLIITALLTTISCNHVDQKVRLAFSFDEKKSNIGNDVGVNLTVFDDRSEKNFIGSKEFCDNQKISLTNDQNLVELLKKEVNEQLLRKGFKQGNDKMVELRIQHLKYKASCGFILGKSETSILIRAIVTNAKTGKKVTKDFELSLNGKHFIIPLASTDASSINDVLDELAAKILDDDMIVRN